MSNVNFKSLVSGPPESGVTPAEVVLRALVDGVPEATPTNAASATVTFDFESGSNSVVYTAVKAGAAGNLLMVGYASPLVSAETAVGVVGNVIVITPGTKARMVVTGTLTDGTDPVVFPTLFYAGELTGKPKYTDNGTLTADTYSLYWDGSSWILTNGVATWYLSAAIDFPDEGAVLAPQSPATGDATVTAGTSSAAQAIAAVNADAQASQMVLATADGTVTDAIGAVSGNLLVGGADATQMECPIVKDADKLYVNVGTYAAPVWKSLTWDV